MTGRTKMYATASEATRAAERRIIASGGARKTLLLPASAISGLKSIKTATGERYDTGIIERLIVEAVGRLQTT